MNMDDSHTPGVFVCQFISIHQFHISNVYVSVFLGTFLQQVREDVHSGIVIAVIQVDETEE